MEEVLEKLYKSLYTVFEENLKSKEKKYNEQGELDVFKTLLTLSKVQKELVRLVELSAIERAVLVYDFSKEDFEECLKSKMIRQGLTINDSKYFISANGLYHYYKSNGLSIADVFISYDELKFSSEEIVLKSQEKIWCIFLLLFGADGIDNKLNLTKLNQNDLEKYYSFLQLIEAKISEKGLTFGKEIPWSTGKNTNFRRFITNNVLLPKTGIYYDRPTNNYYLDLTTRKNVKYFLDLLLDNYDGVERILANELFRDALRELSNSLLEELSIIPKDLNNIVVEELYG